MTLRPQAIWKNKQQNQRSSKKNHLENFLSRGPQKIIRPRVWPGTGLLAETAATRQKMPPWSPWLLSFGHARAWLAAAGQPPTIPALSSPIAQARRDHRFAMGTNTSNLGHGKSVMEKSRVLQRDQQNAHVLAVRWYFVSLQLQLQQAEYTQPSSWVAPQHRLAELAKAVGRIQFSKIWAALTQARIWLTVRLWAMMDAVSLATQQ